MESKQRVAVVTGAGTGIGKASTIALLKSGFKVALTGRRLELLQETIDASGVDPANALAVQADVGIPSDVAHLFNAIKVTFGRLDLLFNNAGLGAPGVLLEELTFDQWKLVVDTNLTGSFLCTKEAFKIMKDQQPMGGRIINNGSVSADAPRPNSAPYTATKHAITGLTKSTSLDGRKYDISCCQIDIGNTDTEMASKMKTGVPQADGSIRAEPTFDVERVAETVLYIANLPLDTTVLFMTIMATKMPLVGRG